MTAFFDRIDNYIALCQAAKEAVDAARKYPFEPPGPEMDNLRQLLIEMGVPCLTEEEASAIVDEEWAHPGGKEED